MVGKVQYNLTYHILCNRYPRRHHHLPLSPTHGRLLSSRHLTFLKHHLAQTTMILAYTQYVDVTAALRALACQRLHNLSQQYHHHHHSNDFCILISVLLSLSFLQSQRYLRYVIRLAGIQGHIMPNKVMSRYETLDCRFT